MHDARPSDSDFETTKPSPWPFRFWVAVTLVAAGFLLTDLLVSGGAGGLVIDWKVGPAFVAVLGGVWGAHEARRALAAANAEDDRIAEAETRGLLQEVARDRLHRPLTGPTDDELEVRKSEEGGPPTSETGS